MRRDRTGAFAVLLALAPIAQPVSAADESPHPRVEEKQAYWNQALEPLGLTAGDVRIDPLELLPLGGDDWGMPILKVWLAAPLRLPRYVRFYRDWFFTRLDEETPIHDVLMYMSGFAGGRVRRGRYYEPLDPLRQAAKEPDALLHGVEQLYDALDKRCPNRVRRRLRSATRAMTPELHEAMALVIMAAAESLQWHSLAFEQVSVDERRELALRAWDLIDADFGTPPDREAAALYGKVDAAYLFAGALDLSEAVDDAVRILSSTSATLESPPLDIRTPIGRIVVSPEGDDIYDEDHYLFVVDFQGRDTYRSAGAVHNPEQPIAVVLDLDGDDRYEAAGPDRPSAGSAFFGYAMVHDAKGRDIYRGRRFAQGTGTFGVGVLHDLAGDDIYEATSAGQGAGNGGLGLLVDEAGDDRYELYQNGQGFGFTRGFGLLIDRSGDDDYIANDTDIEFPSSQTTEHNSSNAQGCGLGLRDDLVTGHSMGGGLGMLLDRAGNDEYEAGVFAQGTGYWYGAGILADSEGDDRYRGAWYVQGAAAHFGAGALRDEAGNDRYEATINVSHGAGHDYSVGLLQDESGHDEYTAANLSLGAANANGIGLFIERSGDDVYHAGPEFNFGGSQVGAPDRTLRDVGMSLGVFLDLGGRDAYNRPFCGNDKQWRLRDWQNPAGLLPAEMGVGMDIEWNTDAP